MKSLSAHILEKLLINKDYKGITLNSLSEWIPIKINYKTEKFEAIAPVRVVSTYIYEEFLKNGHTRALSEIENIEELGPVTKNRDEALDCVYDFYKENRGYKGRSYMQTKRKSKIKTNADFIIWCTSAGKMSKTGTSYWKWKLWDEYPDYEIYFDFYGRRFLIGPKGSLDVDFNVYCVDDSNQKQLTQAPEKIIGVSRCDLNDFVEEYKKLFPKRCKQPVRAFGKVTDGLPWSDFGNYYLIDSLIKN